MDFALVPPEVNSARIYTGPGSGPLLAAAAAWETLAADLYSTASAYQSVVSSLTAGPWIGPSAAAMASAAYPYVEWARTSAAQAEESATQAQAAAVAYETAFAETVPPPVIAANRTLLMALIATNIFGQNTPAIAATEALYSEMWAQDSSAMYGYAGSSAAASTLTPFSEPPSNTNPGGEAAQSAAVAQAVGTDAGTAQSTVQQVFSAVPNDLTSLASPAAAPAAAAPLGPLDYVTIVDALTGFVGVGLDGTLATLALPYDIGGYHIGVHTDDIVSGWAGIQSFPGTAPAPPTPFPVITNLGSPVAASMGEGKLLSGLTVPRGWAAAAPELRALELALPAVNVSAAAEGSVGSMFSQMALAGMAGRAMAGSVGGGGAGAGTGRRERVGAATHKPVDPPKPTEPREPSEPLEPTENAEVAAAPQIPPGGPITSIAAELRELASLRDAGILTDAEFTEQKALLLPHRP